ncbi:hypothetical protein O6H91_21G034900 [Diphasiastrum complanatum]|uniref:Uncharacterized protein n=1 Tax=Diphasiastrum complanatum TaxID=34168 RepID=A0ACC2AJE1_DIPCM|nr:hypothetical protein O6H91_21G034900 [Diphasiastrum complanatum]
MPRSTTDPPGDPLQGVHKDSRGLIRGWKEFLWGGLAGAFGETIMHPVDTLKTRIQSAGQFGYQQQRQTNIRNVLKSVLATDGIGGLYRGIIPGMAGSLVTGATYFGFIESTKGWLEEKRPHLAGPWAHFLAGAAGDTLGSVIYVPCEVIKQRMQVQGSRKAWEQAYSRAAIPSSKLSVTNVYYSGLFHATRFILKHEGWKGLYAGFFSTLARDVPFAGFQIMFYEAFREAVERGHRKWYLKGLSKSNQHEFSSYEEFLLGGAAGGLSAFLTTPLDVIKTRLQVQGTSMRYKSWHDALQVIWRTEGFRGFFKGCVPRVVWWCPASALTFMAVEKLRRQFNGNMHTKNQLAQSGLSKDRTEATVDVPTVVVSPPSQIR